eukprot:gene1481-4639_t
MANPLRFVLAFAKMKWKEFPLRERQQMIDLISSGKLTPFCQVPMLELCGQCYTQSFATIRYLAVAYNLYGIDFPERETRYHVDMLAEGARDFYTKFVSLPFASDPDIYKQSVLYETTLPKYLPIFESLLGQNSFLTGKHATYADAVLMAAVEFVIDLFGKDTLQEYRHLSEWYTTMSRHEGISWFLSSSCHYQLPNEDYVKEVNKTLGRG